MKDNYMVSGLAIIYLLMKKLMTLLFNILLSIFAFGQNCKCPVNQYSGSKANAIFHLSNGNSIALCGSEEKDILKGKILYSEFVLSVCGSNKIIKFWDAATLCDLKVINNTLLVNTLVNLPVDKSMSYQYIAWTIERIYFARGRVVRDSIINPQIPLYTTTQVMNVINLYHHTANKNDEKTAELIDKLFICAISGNKKARYYLKEFQSKFTNLDGVYLEQYDDDFRMLELWDKMKHH